MSTKYTREQIDKARQLADHAFRETAHRNRQDDCDIVAGAMRRPGDEWIDVFTEVLGLDVEPEKPEPVELNEGEVEAAFVAYVAVDNTGYSFNAFHAGYRAALAKHGPRRQITRAAVMDAYTGGTMTVSSLDTQAIDRIMALLEGSK